MSTIKNYTCVVLVLGVLGLAAIPSAAQRVSQPERGLSASQLSAVISTKLSACTQNEPTVSRVNARAIAMDGNKQTISMDRIERTLNGVWRGQVKGNYDRKLLAKDGSLNVDYLMVVDVKRGEALVFEQFGASRTAATLRAKPGAPVWSYISCGKAQYKPRNMPAQVHQFVKVSDNIEDARALLSSATKMAFDAKRGEVVLSDIWQRLVESKYFDDRSRSLAFAGGFFKLKMGNVPSAVGGSLFDLNMQAEYRGSGQTVAKFTPGEPIRGVEQGQFLGVSMNQGDFLISSLKNGLPMKKGGVDSSNDIDMFFDKVVIGPLAR